MNSRLAKGLLMCTLAALFYAYEYYLRVAPSVMNHELKTYFNLSEAGLGFLSGLFYLAYTPAQLIIGVFMDKYGPRLVLSGASFICTVGTYLFLSELLLVAQIGRFLLGFGSAFAFVGVLKTTSNWLPKRYFALITGLATTLGMLGANAGQVVMSYSMEKTSWQNTLYIAVILSFILSCVLWIFLRDTPLNSSRSMHSSNSYQIISIRSFKDIFFSKQLWMIGFIGCMAFMTLSAFAELWAIPYLETTRQFSKQSAAFGSSLVFLGFGFGAPLAGYLSEKLESRKIPLIFGLLLTTILFCMLFLKLDLSEKLIYFILFFIGFFSGVEILVFALAHDISSNEVNASSIAFINFIVMISGSLMQPCIGKAIDITILYLPTMPLATVYQCCLFSLPCSLVIGIILTLCLKVK